MARIVRDHTTAPIIRDHRTQAPSQPVVRDHRTQSTSQPVVRDHRNIDPGFTPSGPANTRPSVVIPPVRMPSPPPSIAGGAFPVGPVPMPVVGASSFPATVEGLGGILNGGNVNSSLDQVSRTMGTSEAQVVANMGPGTRDMYNQLLKDDPKQARSFLIQEMMASLKLLGEMLSNVSKTRSEISMTFARNSRG